MPQFRIDFLLNRRQADQAARAQIRQLMDLERHARQAGAALQAAYNGTRSRSALGSGSGAATQQIRQQVVSLNQLRDAGVRAYRDLERAEARRVRASQRASASVALAAQRQAAAVDRSGDAYRRLGTDGSAGLGKISAAALAGGAAIGAMTTAAAGLGEAIESAARKSRELAANFGDQRDQLRELASVEGKPLDNAYTLNFARGNVRTGLRPEESARFQGAFLGSGEQFKGRTISDKEFSQFRQQSASLATATGINPEVIGDLAGKTLGFKDRRAAMDQASESALGELNQNIKILQRGSGGNATLVSQAARITSRLLSDDETKGIFKSSKEAAIAESVVAEAAPDEADTAVRAAVRGLRGFKGEKQSGLLKAAGISESTGFLESVKKLAPAVEAERAKGPAGTKTQDVLAKYFTDERTRNALNVFLNKGIGGGIIADREAFAAKMEQGPGGADAARGRAALDEIRKFQTSEAGQARKADAQIRLAEMERGAKSSKIDIIRKQALAEMIANGEIDTTGSNVHDFVVGKASFGMIGDVEQERINVRAAEIAARRADKAGVGGGWNSKAGITLNPFDSGYERGLNYTIGQIERAGFDPLSGNQIAVKQRNQALGRLAAPAVPPAAAGRAGADAARNQAEMVKLLREQNALLRAQGVPAARVQPAPPPIPQGRRAPAGVPLRP